MTRTLHEPWPKPKRPPSARDPPSQSAAPQKTAESISRKPYQSSGLLQGAVGQADPVRLLPLRLLRPRPSLQVSPPHAPAPFHLRRRLTADQPRLYSSRGCAPWRVTESGASEGRSQEER